MPKKAEVPAKPAEPPAKPAEAPKRTEAPAKPAEAPKKAEAPAKPAEAPKPTATKPPAETPAAPSTTPVKPPTPPRTATPVSKLPPVTAGAIAAGTIAGDAAAKMAQRESAGNKPDSYFLANFVKDGDTTGTNKIVKGNIDITTNKPFEKSLNEMSITEVIELAKRRSKFFGKSGAGAAMGKYQFMPGTLHDQAVKLFGPWALYQPFDEKNQELLQLSLINQNAKALLNAKLPITDASLYLMHFFGNSKQTALVLNGEDSDSMNDILGPAGARANPNIAKLTVGQYKKSYLMKTFDMKLISYEELLKQNNLVTPSGRTEDYKKRLNHDNENSNLTDSERRQANIQKAAQIMINKDPILRNMLKKENGDNVDININAPTTIINKQTPKQSISKPTSADRPAIAGIP